MANSEVRPQTQKRGPQLGSRSEDQSVHWIQTGFEVDWQHTCLKQHSQWLRAVQFQQLFAPWPPLSNSRFFLLLRISPTTRVAQWQSADANRRPPVQIRARVSTLDRQQRPSTPSTHVAQRKSTRLRSRTSWFDSSRGFSSSSAARLGVVDC
jgi:hypothetical protein